MTISDVKYIELPRINDNRGNLSFIESSRHIPFEIKRVYYLYDVPGGASRAGHGHKRLHQLMIAMSGSFDVTLDDGIRKNKYHLNRSYNGLYIPPKMWRDLNNFSSGAVCLVLVSEFYDEDDYIRDYPTFLNYVRGTSS
ncbi:MAG: FdtA/QdtA family cupin domain-containing protein [Candidatus Thiodiazotropha sp. (ex Myrtea sp. 'scaly one' KF741663)]|nr:FdtA/QdtA family cupin domain-containing protein [Candidatus Thiodiazotropha sp. (ex Myrtea sp. 'scaly one' KF741663)]